MFDKPPLTVTKLHSLVPQAIGRHRPIHSRRSQQPNTCRVNKPQRRRDETRHAVSKQHRNKGSTQNTTHVDVASNKKQTEHAARAYDPEQVLPEEQLLSFVPQTIVASGSFMRAVFGNHRPTRVNKWQPH